MNEWIPLIVFVAICAGVSALVWPYVSAWWQDQQDLKEREVRALEKLAGLDNNNNQSSK
jgi:hypothetical protein